MEAKVEAQVEAICRELDESAAVKLSLKTISGKILAFAREMYETLRSGGKVVFCGNGGSAADAQHLAAELVGRFLADRRALPGLALTVNTSALTAISNDWSFDDVFARQVQALVTPKDMLVGISAGGNSTNVLRAIAEARRIGARTVGLVGKGGGQMGQMVDLPIVVGSDRTPRIQEAHITIGHIVCGLVEQWVEAQEV
jgi:D-sedoheptulose 7-phosphate isomerase